MNFVIYSFENSWVVSSEYTPADKNMFKVDSKEMFQENLQAFLHITVKESVMESAFSKASDLHCKWQWES